MAPGGVEPPHTDSKSVALSAELRGPERRVQPPQRRALPASAATAVRRMIRRKSCAEGATFGGGGGGWDSNPRPPGPQPGALPTELPPPRGHPQDSGAPAVASIASELTNGRPGSHRRPHAAARVAFGEPLDQLLVERRSRLVLRLVTSLSRTTSLSTRLARQRPTDRHQANRQIPAWLGATLRVPRACSSADRAAAF